MGKKRDMKEKIKEQRRMLQIQADSLQAMVEKVDNMYDAIKIVKAKAFDMIAGKARGERHEIKDLL